ncbi:hypothetical protein L0665_06040 [Methanogenium marinum]|uniref:Uncharacterized protein n=1 Tax=Methanogenium marinum TaxID=348610 RepID=A0A9Q4KTV9_9EURY|nr:hypothetical protein [Methanogenium marinum]MDE4908168.1 hypothetical protein [Methanogenium marinum]
MDGRGESDGPVTRNEQDSTGNHSLHSGFRCHLKILRHPSYPAVSLIDATVAGIPGDMDGDSDNDNSDDGEDDVFTFSPRFHQKTVKSEKMC